MVVRFKVIAPFTEMNRYRCWHFLPVTVVLLLIASCDRPDSHTWMRGELDEVRTRAADENPFFGRKRLRNARHKLEELTGQESPREVFNVHLAIGEQELRAGNSDQSIEHYLIAYSMLERLGDDLSPEDKQSALFQLGLAYFRKGETDNCVCCHTCDSCLLPIRAGGIHQKQEGSLNALKYLTLLLEEDPDHTTACWLLNLAHMTLGDYPEGVPEQWLISPEKFESDEVFPRFFDVAPGLGLNAFSLAGSVIVDDFDNDNDLDIVTSSSDTSESIRFFRNNSDGSFSDCTKNAGFEGIYGGLNIIQADYDNDGDLDIFVPRGGWFGTEGQHPNSLLQNNGTGSFRDVSRDAGLAEVHYPTQTAAWADYDNDGDLDLYVGNESRGKLTAPCQLFKNNGDGTFRDVATHAKVRNLAFAKAVVWGDYNRDQFPDLYVSNYNGPNRLYRNNRDGTFAEVAEPSGVSGPTTSFPAWFWDFNNDGKLDLFVSDYDFGHNSAARSYLGHAQSKAPRLYKGNGKGEFHDVAPENNLIRNTQPMGSNFGDLDNDGFPDFYLGTGYPKYEGLMPNLMYRNLGGKGFADVTTPGGFGHLQKGHGIAFADLDHDGDQDVYVQMGGAYAGDAFGNALFENPGFGNHWLTLKLIGERSNRSAIGARIHVRLSDEGKERSVYQWVNSGGSFGANPLRREIGLGKANQIELLEIFWPTTGLTQRFRNVPVDCILEITEGDTEYRRLETETFSLGGGSTQ